MPYMAAVENVIESLFCRAGSMVGEAVSSTLQVLRCTELSHPIDVEGHSGHIEPANYFRVTPDSRRSLAPQDP